ncbi:9823_t:CDS:1, partial [Scutellospora calospora]
ELRVDFIVSCLDGLEIKILDNISQSEYNIFNQSLFVIQIDPNGSTRSDPNMDLDSADLNFHGSESDLNTGSGSDP